MAKMGLEWPRGDVLEWVSARSWASSLGCKIASSSPLSEAGANHPGVGWTFLPLHTQYL